MGECWPKEHREKLEAQKEELGRATREAKNKLPLSKGVQ